MLELFTTPIFEIMTFFIKNAGTKSGYKKSARAAIRLYWLLSKLEEHSETFVEALEIIRNEKRIPSRLKIALTELYEDIEELKKMLIEDRFGFYTGFWCVWEVFGEGSKGDFEKLVGVKLARLDLWADLLKQIKEQTALIVETSDFVPPPMCQDGFYRKDLNYSLSNLVSNNQLKIYKFTDLQRLNNEILNSRSVIKKIEEIKTDLSAFIKANYAFEDLL